MSKTRSFNVAITVTATAVVTEDDVKEAIEYFKRDTQRVREWAATGDKEGVKALKILEQLVPGGEITEENFDEVFPHFVRAGFRQDFREDREISLRGKEWSGLQADVKVSAKGGSNE